MTEPLSSVQPDHLAVLDLIPEGSTVLDLGCGNGDLLALLLKEKKARGQGIEIDEQEIYKCVAKGLNVFHGDIDTGLAEYRDKSFDYVILNQSLQQVKHVEEVLDDAMRVGQKVIVGFPNFAYLRSRLQLFFGGKTPITPTLPYTWHTTPNIHFLSISDFMTFCRQKNIHVEKTIHIGQKNRVCLWPNLFATVGIFLISK
ncbi:MAG TPA: methionine biosynthesis protein MetW [Elusimicrobiota bacterium]|nr:methionine biosynthesis protein MetW [Elusimicrobiota bacterium]